MIFGMRAVIASVMTIGICAVAVYVVILLIRALRKYIRSKPVWEELAGSTKTLCEALKRHRTRCKMTQEFVWRRHLV